MLWVQCPFIVGKRYVSINNSRKIKLNNCFLVNFEQLIFLIIEFMGLIFLDFLLLLLFCIFLNFGQLLGWLSYFIHYIFLILALGFLNSFLLLDLNLEPILKLSKLTTGVLIILQLTSFTYFPHTRFNCCGGDPRLVSLLTNAFELTITFGAEEKIKNTMVAMVSIEWTVDLTHKTQIHITVTTLLLILCGLLQPNGLASKERQLMGHLLGLEVLLTQKTQVYVVFDVMQVDC